MSTTGQTRAFLRTLVKRNDGRIIVNAMPAAELAPRPEFETQPTDETASDNTLPDGEATFEDGLNSPAHEKVFLPDDPLQQLAYAGGTRRGWVLRLRRAMRWLWEHRPWRPPTAEQLRARMEMRARRQMEATLRNEARVFRKRIVNALDRLGLCYRYRKSERDFLISKKKSVAFDAVVMQPEALYFRVDTPRLPNGINVMQLVTPEVLTDLTITCGQRVNAEYSEKIGCWFILERASGARGVPLHVTYSDMYDKIPDTADSLTIPVGMRGNSRAVYESITRMPHMLIAGSTRSGKSNFVNVMLCTLLLRNTPANLKLLLVDLKGGIELNPYRGVPHLVTVDGQKDSIINKKENVIPALEWLLAEGERRIALIESSGKRSIATYNAKQKNLRKVIPRLIFLVDEYANIALSDLKNKAEPLLTDICQRMGGVGIHVIICTQRPEVRVVSGLIKGVLDCRIAFRTPNNASSIVILDSAAARGLQPQGRAVWKLYDEYELQTPFMPEFLNDEIIKKVKAGESKDVKGMKRHDVSESEVMAWALDNCEGRLSGRDLYRQFKDRHLPQAELEAWLGDWEGNEFVVKDALYRVEASAGGVPRRLVAVRRD